MASNLGVVLDIGADPSAAINGANDLEAGVTSAMRSAAANATAAAEQTSAATQQMSDSFDRAALSGEASFTKARLSAMALSEEMGVHMPRAVETFIARLPGLESALSYAFPVIGAIGLIAVLEQIPKVYDEMIDKLAGWGEAEQKAFADQSKMNEAVLKGADEIRKAHEEDALIGLSGMGRVTQETHNYNIELGVYKDKLKALTDQQRDLSELVGILEHGPLGPQQLKEGEGLLKKYGDLVRSTLVGDDLADLKKKLADVQEKANDAAIALQKLQDEPDKIAREAPGAEAEDAEKLEQRLQRSTDLVLHGKELSLKAAKEVADGWERIQNVQAEEWAKAYEKQTEQLRQQQELQAQERNLEMAKGPAGLSEQAEELQRSFFQEQRAASEAGTVIARELARQREGFDSLRISARSSMDGMADDIGQSTSRITETLRALGEAEQFAALGAEVAGAAQAMARKKSADAEIAVICTTAAIDAAMQTAEGMAALASMNDIGAALHFAAAAEYISVAAMKSIGAASGGGTGGSRGGGGGGGGSRYGRSGGGGGGGAVGYGEEGTTTSSEYTGGGAGMSGGSAAPIQSQQPLHVIVLGSDSEKAEFFAQGVQSAVSAGHFVPSSNTRRPAPAVRSL